MADLKAKTTLLKAQYFLEQAKLAEAAPSILADVDRLPFAANLEAAIIYAHSSIDHLHNEFAPIHNSKGYRTWHDRKWQALCSSNPVVNYFANRRNFIVHQEPEKTTAHVFLEARGSIMMSSSVSMTVTRANGMIEKPNSDRPADVPNKQDLSAKDNTHERPTASSSRQSQQFFFADPDWRAKSAVAYVGNFIDACREFISAAEAKFQS
jgi:hypothetical protein